MEGSNVVWADADALYIVSRISECHCFSIPNATNLHCNLQQGETKFQLSVIYLATQLEEKNKEKYHMWCK